MLDGKFSQSKKATGSANGSEDKPNRILILHHDSKTLASQIRSTRHSASVITTHTDMDELISSGFPEVPSCLVLGYRLSCGSCPLRVIGRLRQEKWWLPILFLSRESDVKSVVEVMRAGAYDFLLIPVDKTELNQSLTSVLEKANKSYAASRFAVESKRKLDSLSNRERSIVQLVINGLLNKEIASQLELAVITVKVYRAQAMKKMGAQNPADLVKIAFFGGMNFDGNHVPKCGVPEKFGPA